MHQDQFHKIADAVQSMCTEQEEFTLSLSAENSDFVRFNHAKIRQPGSVKQQSISIRLIQKNKHASSKINLSGDFSRDTKQLENVFARLREQLEVVGAVEDMVRPVQLFHHECTAHPLSPRRLCSRWLGF